MIKIEIFRIGLNDDTDVGEYEVYLTIPALSMDDPDIRSDGYVERVAEITGHHRPLGWAALARAAIDELERKYNDGP